MTDLNIFDAAKPQSGDWVKFVNVGDSIQGTYVDVRNGTDSFGNQQTIYVLQDASGKVWNLGFRNTASVIHERMDGIKFGQIVGFRFDEHRDSKKNPGTKVKIIRIYADPKLLDHEWLKHQKEIEATYVKPTDNLAPHEPTVDEVFDNLDKPTTEVPFEAPAEAKASTVTAPPKTTPTTDATTPSNNGVDAIRTLAKTKGLTTEAMTEKEADAAIKKYTGLTLNEENLTKIIIALTGYVSK